MKNYMPKSMFEIELKGLPLYNFVKSQCSPYVLYKYQKWKRIVAKAIIANPTDMLLPVVQNAGDPQLRKMWNLVKEIRSNGGEIFLNAKYFIGCHYCLDDFVLIPKKGCENKFKFNEKIYFLFQDDINDTLERSKFGIYLKPRERIEGYKKMVEYLKNE